MKKAGLFILIFLGIYSLGISQNPDLNREILQFQQKLRSLDSLRLQYENELEVLKLNKIRYDLKSLGLPSEDYIEHSAIILNYNEEYEQANWVAHIILPDIAEGAVFRSNDFREDPKIESGTAVEEDYFLKFLQADSSFVYDGYGFDRGHLAPSADFRWSATALSESYYYSNMSPQLPSFNRESWAELEAYLRSYVIEKNVPLYIVTIPVFGDNPAIVERSQNQLAIPASFLKIALDLENGKGIAFQFPHLKINSAISDFAISIDAAEKIAGFDFFHKLPDEKEQKIEAQFDKKYWFPDLSFGDKSMLSQPDLPPGHFNTKVGGRFMGKNKKINVCGHVVSTRYSREGHLWINLDKNFPNQIFSVFIRKKDLVNFSYDPLSYLKGKIICVEGNVENFNGTPTVNIDKEVFIKMYKSKK